MTKIGFDDKIERFPVNDEDYQLSADNVNEIKQSVNDLYDATGIGAVSDNLIVVSINTGGATNKIKNTLDAITTSGPANRYLVQVRPGTYIEDNFTIPQYVAVIGVGTDRVTLIDANTTTGTLVTLSPNASFISFDISGKTGGTAINILGAGGCKVEDLTFNDCLTCINVNNAAAEAVVHQIDFEDNITTGINILAGNVDIDNIDVGSGYAVDTILNIDGSNSASSIHNILSISSSVNYIMKINNGCLVSATAIQAEFFNDGIVISGSNCNVKINTMTLLDGANDGVRIENVGTGITLNMFDTSITGCANYNVNFINPNSIIIGNGFSEIDKFYIAPGVEMYAYILDTKPGDEGFNIRGELHVGSPDSPVESVLGEGDSHTKLLAYTTTNDVAFTNITTEAKSYTGSTFTFPALTAGSSIYVANMANDSSGNPLPFFGIKTIVTTAAVLGTGSFTVQYYNSVSGWLDISYMETQSSNRYYQYANNIFTHTGSFHIRNDINIAVEDAANLIWEINDPVSYGENRYWLRYRIISPITTAPIFEQFKIHTNRIEINGDGWLEFFANARPKSNLAITLGAGRELAGSMSDVNIWIDQNLGVGLKDNQYNLTTQYFGFSGAVPEDLDTSSGLTLIIACRADAAGSITLQLTVGKVTDGDSVYTSNPALIPIDSRTAYTDTQTFSGANELKYYTFKIETAGFRARKDPVDGSTAVDIVFFTLNATSLPTNIQMVHLENYYYSWSSGGHI